MTTRPQLQRPRPRSTYVRFTSTPALRCAHEPTFPTAGRWVKSPPQCQQPLARPPVGFAVFEGDEAALAYAGWLDQQADDNDESELTPERAGALINDHAVRGATQ